MAQIRENARMVAEADPTRSSQQKLAVERAVVDAYTYGLQSSPNAT